MLVLDLAAYHKKFDDEDQNQTTSWKKAHLYYSIKQREGPDTKSSEDWENSKLKHNYLTIPNFYPTPKSAINILPIIRSSLDFKLRFRFLSVSNLDLNAIEMA